MLSVDFCHENSRINWDNPEKNAMYEYYFRIPYVWSHYLSEAQNKILKKKPYQICFIIFVTKNELQSNKSVFNSFCEFLCEMWLFTFVGTCSSLHDATYFLLQPVSDFNLSSTTNIFLCYDNIKGLLVFLQKIKFKDKCLTWLLKVFNVVLSKSIASKASFRRYFASKFAFKICP